MVPKVRSRGLVLRRHERSSFCLAQEGLMMWPRPRLKPRLRQKAEAEAKAKPNKS
jgi:hypothetical protein